MDLGNMFAVQAVMGLVDNITGPLRSVNAGMESTEGRVGRLSAKMRSLGKAMLPITAAAGIVLATLTGTVMATAETQKALGELASVGVQDMAALEKAGTRFSGQWAGTTKAQFIAAAYDIKSGISTLTDTGVAEFTKLAALTGKATKSTTAEMTSLFATGYGIYKDMYADLSDMQFGEVFSAGIAASVKSFKTTGSGMAQAISQLGAVATTAKVPLEEQLTILGMLQATMSGSEAGTKYKALMQAAAGAGAKLNLQFMDANNQLLSMPDILTKLRSRYGDTLDAMEKMEIQKAFGTQEAVAVIDLLYGKVGALADNTRSLSAAMRQGTGFTEQMAATMNQDIGAGIQLLGQRMHNLVEVIGKQLIPVMAPVMSLIGQVVNWITAFAEKHSTLTRIIVISVGVIAALAFGIGTLAAVVGAAGLLWPILVSGIMAVTGAVWGFTVALLANPITWIVLGVVALVAGLVLLYKRFEFVRNIVDKFLFGLGYMAGVIVRVINHFGGLGAALKKAAMLLLSFAFPPLGIALHWDSIKQGISAALEWIKGIIPMFLEAGAKLWDALVSGIKAKIMAPVEIVQTGLEKLRNLLPFSDAKEGPLSALTLSGQRIMETLGAGIQMAVPGLRTVAQGALAGVTASALMVTPVMDRPGVKAPVAERTIEQKSQTTKQTIIQHLAVTLPGVKDAEGFVEQLRRIAEGYDA